MSTHVATPARDRRRAALAPILPSRAAASSRRRARWSSASRSAACPAVARSRKPSGAGPYPDPDFLQLDTWIVIHPNNTATFFVGKTDGGQGTGTAFRQMMCDELDMAYDQTSLVMGTTDKGPDQGGSGGSDGVERDGMPMRRVSAEARRVLLELGSQRLNVPVADLTVRNGTIVAKADATKRVTYAELVGGKRFDVTLTGRNVDATTGTASVKPVNELRVIGTSVQRYDIPGKVDGSLHWAVDTKVPGMLHARNVRPPVAGATLKSIDESSVSPNARFRARRAQRQLRRRRLRARGAGDQRLARAQSRVDAAGDGAVPGVDRAVRLHPRRHADERGDGGRRRPGRRVRERCAAPRGRVRGAVPRPHLDRPGARDGGSVQRSADDLLERHEVVRAAQRRRAVPQHAARARARRLHGRPAGLRPHGGGRRRLRGRVLGERAARNPCACSGCGTRRRRGTRRARRTCSS